LASLVLTDAYTQAWEPAPKPFMTIILTFGREAGKTRYTALVRHWTVADREAHEKMGFHQGWGQCADQLAALVAKLLHRPLERLRREADQGAAPYYAEALRELFGLDDEEDP
jgi:hypothetical protein